MKQFDNHDDLLNDIFKFIWQRDDLLDIQYHIRKALKDRVPDWGLDYIYQGICCPIYNRDDNIYTFQIAVRNPPAIPTYYHNITIYRDNAAGHSEFNAAKSLREIL